MVKHTKSSKHKWFITQKKRAAIFSHVVTQQNFDMRVPRCKSNHLLQMQSQTQTDSS